VLLERAWAPSTEPTLREPTAMYISPTSHSQRSWQQSLNWCSSGRTPAVVPNEGASSSEVHDARKHAHTRCDCTHSRQCQQYSSNPHQRNAQASLMVGRTGKKTQPPQNLLPPREEMVSMVMPRGIRGAHGSRDSSLPTWDQPGTGIGAPTLQAPPYCGRGKCLPLQNEIAIAKVCTPNIKGD
jgi:hypothetical protein